MMITIISLAFVEVINRRSHFTELSSEKGCTGAFVSMLPFRVQLQLTAGPPSSVTYIASESVRHQRDYRSKPSLTSLAVWASIAVFARYWLQQPMHIGASDSQL